jgi:hypothetical protein
LQLTISLPRPTRPTSKKVSVSIDGKECMKIDNKDLNNVSIADMSGNDVIYLKLQMTNTVGVNKIIFVNSRKSFHSQQYIYANAKMLLKRLL